MKFLPGLVLLVCCGPQGSDIQFVRTEPCPPGAPVADALGAELPSRSETAAAAAPAADTPPQWDTEGAGPLTGFFAVEAVIHGQVMIKLDSRLFLLAELLQQGTHVKERVALCRMELPSIPDVAEIVVTPEMEALLQSKTKETSFDVDSAEPPIGFDPPPYTVVVGADLADPVNDPLPTKDDLSTAADEDGDGNPGVTLKVDAVLCEKTEDLYVAIRSTADLDGEAPDGDHIEGALYPTLDETILGYSDPCIESAAALKVKILSGNTFKAVRVDGGPFNLDGDGDGKVSCSDVTAHLDELFPKE